MWPTTTTTTPSTLSSSPRTFPSFPMSPMSPLSPTFAPSLDVEMLDAYTTPPSTRILPATSTLRFSVDPPPKPVLTPYRIPVHPNAPKQFGPRGTLSPIKISLLATTEAPLTPPLTPPCPPFLSLPPIEIQAVSPPSFPTLASRLLSNYPLHPLFDAQYTICDELGSGGFGFVVRAIRNGDGKGVAVKFIERAKIPSHGWVNSRSWGEAPGLWDAVKGVRTLPMEAYVLRSVRHEGVVAYVDLFEDAKYFYLVRRFLARPFVLALTDDFAQVMEHHGSPWQSPERAAKAVTGPSSLPALASFSSADPILIPPAAFPSTSSSLFSPLPSPPGLSPPPRPTSMQRRSSCDLFECIEQHSRLSEDTAKYVFAQIVEVVWALGKIGICHRDIKDENFVVSADFKVRLSLFLCLRRAFADLETRRSSSSTLAPPSSSTLATPLPSTPVRRPPHPSAPTNLPHRFLRHDLLRLSRNPPRRPLPSPRVRSLVPRHPPLHPRHGRMPVRRRERGAGGEDLEEQDEVGQRGRGAAEGVFGGRGREEDHGGRDEEAFVVEGGVEEVGRA